MEANCFLSLQYYLILGGILLSYSPIWTSQYIGGIHWIIIEWNDSCNRQLCVAFAGTHIEKKNWKDTYQTLNRYCPRNEDYKGFAPLKSPFSLTDILPGPWYLKNLWKSIKSKSKTRKRSKHFNCLLAPSVKSIQGYFWEFVSIVLIGKNGITDFLTRSLCN